jgi:hypothetical protein
MVSLNDKIWYEYPSELLEIDQWFHIFPSKEMSYSQKLNSIFRFGLYFSVIVYLLKANLKIFLFPVFLGFVTFSLNKVHFSQQSEPFFRHKDWLSNSDTRHDVGARATGEGGEDLQQDASSQNCTAPTPQNPFMNVLISDYARNPDRSPACNIEEKHTRRMIRKHFESKLFKNLDDVNDTENSFRQFYTTPSTSIPNDQESFAKWLYFSEEKTCKEGNLSKCFNL